LNGVYIPHFSSELRLRSLSSYHSHGEKPQHGKSSRNPQQTNPASSENLKYDKMSEEYFHPQVPNVPSGLVRQQAANQTSSTSSRHGALAAQHAMLSERIRRLEEDYDPHEHHMYRVTVLNEGLKTDDVTPERGEGFGRERFGGGEMFRGEGVGEIDKALTTALDREVHNDILETGTDENGRRTLQEKYTKLSADERRVREVRLAQYAGFVMLPDGTLDYGVEKSKKKKSTKKWWRRLF
jgi:hypothetical protein